ncbi:MAG: hypothetical protein MZV70_05995 [Desulfobacterales bacterium]|nr:hypothetical protein [Desulfobacterales bacterium]
MKRCRLALFLALIRRNDRVPGGRTDAARGFHLPRGPFLVDETGPGGRETLSGRGRHRASGRARRFRHPPGVLRQGGTGLEGPHRGRAGQGRPDPFLHKLVPDGRYTDIGRALDFLDPVLSELDAPERLKYILLLTDERQEAPLNLRTDPGTTR